jgi:hypothetical protein
MKEKVDKIRIKHSWLIFVRQNLSLIANVILSLFGYSRSTYHRDIRFFGASYFVFMVTGSYISLEHRKFKLENIHSQRGFKKHSYFVISIEYRVHALKLVCFYFLYCFFLCRSQFDFLVFLINNCSLSSLKRFVLKSSIKSQIFFFIENHIQIIKDAYFIITSKKREIKFNSYNKTSRNLFKFIIFRMQSFQMHSLIIAK